MSQCAKCGETEARIAAYVFQIANGHRNCPSPDRVKQLEQQVAELTRKLDRQLETT